MIIQRDVLKKYSGVDYYDGTIIHNRFAYKFCRENTLPIGNVLVFRSPMEVKAEGMIDLEDVLQNDFIYSEDAINIIWEIPCLTDHFGAVAYQRLFNTQIANILSANYLKKPIEVDGDDLIVHAEHTQRGVVQPKGKCSVSITYIKNSAALGHTGININCGEKAPVFAFSTHLNDENSNKFMNDVTSLFYNLNDSLFLATTKIIS